MKIFLKFFSKSVPPPKKHPGYAHVRGAPPPGPPSKPTPLKCSPPNRNPAGAPGYELKITLKIQKSLANVKQLKTMHSIVGTTAVFLIDCD